MGDGNVGWLLTKGVNVGWHVVGWVMGRLAGYLGGRYPGWAF